MGRMKIMQHMPVDVDQLPAVRATPDAVKIPYLVK
jgi:hypothetical protein